MHHEEDEETHLKQFESLLKHASHQRDRLPAVPRQWPALAVQLYGYESLGLEFARLLSVMRPDLASILADEETHVGFFEQEIGKLLLGPAAAGDHAKASANAWWRKVPKTLDRYLEGPALAPFKDRLRPFILGAIERRFVIAGLLERSGHRPETDLTPRERRDLEQRPCVDTCDHDGPKVGRPKDL